MQVRKKKKKKVREKEVRGENLSCGISDLQHTQVLFNPSGLHIPQPLGIEES